MLAKNILNLLRERKVTKTDFARHIEVSRTTLDDYLQERTFMPSDKIIKTAAFFNVTVGYLFGEENTKEKELRELLSDQQRQIEEIKKLLNDILKLK